MASVTEIDALLPQTQCTRCGYPACRPYAEALAAAVHLSRTEGIIPALESSHALAEAFRRARGAKGQVFIVNISGRGDKDIGILRENLKID